MPAHKASGFVSYVYPNPDGPTPALLKVTLPIHGRYHEPSFDGKTFISVDIEPPELLLRTEKCTGECFVLLLYRSICVPPYFAIVKPTFYLLHKCFDIFAKLYWCRNSQTNSINCKGKWKYLKILLNQQLRQKSNCFCLTPWRSRGPEVGWRDVGTILSVCVWCLETKWEMFKFLGKHCSFWQCS